MSMSRDFSHLLCSCPLMMLTYPETVLSASSYEFLTPGEMIRMEALTNDRLARKVSVLHCLMMSHGGELLARYRGLCNTPKIGSHRNGNIGVLRQSTKIKI
ncbi:hypothetical protein Tco_1427576 [Tanacetum coccineum]